jgi:hypothetical protein
MLHPLHTPRFDSPNNIWQGLKIMKLIIYTFPAHVTSSFFGINTYFYQNPVLKCSQSVFQLHMQSRKNYSSVYFHLYAFSFRWEDKQALPKT